MLITSTGGTRVELPNLNRTLGALVDDCVLVGSGSPDFGGEIESGPDVLSWSEDCNVTQYITSAFTII